jgi:Icc-related predicted phosphoesterase
MKIIAITDIHNETGFIEKIKDKIKSADFVFIAGDITHFGSYNDAKKIIESIAEINNNIFAVSGNCDNKDVDNYLEDKGYLLHKKIKKLPNSNFSIAGFSGSLVCPVPTPNTYDEDDYRLFFSDTLYADIIVVHQPPYNTVADKAMKIKHVGSKAVKEFIEKKQPLLCFCGHIHESSGIEYLGKTLIVNPGAFKEGCYSIITGDDSQKFKAEILTA